MFHVENDKYITVGPENEFGMRRVQALRSFGDVHEGDIGGYIQDEMNLSERGSCWIYDDAMVMGSSRVKDDAQVHGGVIVSGKSEINCEAYLGGRVKVKDTYVSDIAAIDCDGTVEDCEIAASSRIKGEVELCGCLCCGHSIIDGQVTASGVKIYDDAKLLCNTNIVSSTFRDECCVEGSSVVKNSQCEGSVHIHGASHVYDCELSGDINVENTELECKQLSGTACYRDGEDIQEKYSQRANDIVETVSDDLCEYALPSDVIF